MDCDMADWWRRWGKWGTIQLDVSMPERFELVYTDKDNTEKVPVMIHRAILGSLERFMGILIEHYGGNMPLWLAPEQMRILPISEKSNDYAQKLHGRLKDAQLRCGLDVSDEKIGAKIARAHGAKVGYMLVVGPKEAQSQMVALRMRGSRATKLLKIDKLIGKVKCEIADNNVVLALVQLFNIH